MANFHNQGNLRATHHHALVPTRFSIPQMQGTYVKRSQLEKKLHDLNHYQVGLISATAGYGKTRLAAEFALKRSTPACWLNLHENDNGFVHFWTYFIGALHQKYHGISFESLKPLNQELATEAWIASLITDLIQLKDHELLVLNNYQVIENQAIHDAVFSLMEHLPSQLHMIMLTVRRQKK